MHDALSKFTNTCNGSLHDTEKLRTSIIGHFNDAWFKREHQILKLGLSEKEIKNFYDDSIRMLTDWLEKYTRAVSKGLNHPLTEVKLFCKKHGVMGIIDAIYKHNGKVYLVDYKTGKKDEVTRDIKIQMAIYALLYQEKFGEKPHTVSVDFLKTKTIKRFKVTDKAINNAINICKKIHEKTSSDNESDYPCTCGGWCERDFFQENG